jgi:hypothetical protein
MIMPKNVPNRHPTYLLHGMTFGFIQPTAASHTKPQVALVDTFEGFQMVLGANGNAFELQLETNQRIEELREVLNRALNSWDQDAPKWVWQLDAFLNAELRQVAIDDVTGQTAIRHHGV